MTKRPLRLFFNMLQRLVEDRHDVLVVERIEDDAPVAARADESQAAQQAQLMRHRGLAQLEHGREVAHAQLAVRQGIEIRTRVGSPSALKVSARP